MTWRRGTRRYLAILVLLAAGAEPRPAEAYTRETHYYLRFALALATCFDYDEAHLIASGDWMMDGNLSTHAEPHPFGKRNKVGFHAFGHSDARFNELWERSRAEPDLELRLIKLGQFMHFLEDWESHAGYGLALGHAKATFGGRDPDSLGSDPAKNQRMVQSALDHLLRTCSDLGRLDVEWLPTDDPDYSLAWLMRRIEQDGIMRDLYEIGDPAWKKGKIKGVRKSHLEIRDRTRERVEDLVAALRAYPEKRVPEWFDPRDPEKGIPEALQIPYDKEGNILASPNAPDPVEEILARNRADREDEDVQLWLDSSSQFSGGFQIRLRAENVGSEASDAGEIEVFVVDADREEELGRASVELEALPAGAAVEKTATVRARTSAGQEVIIGAIARVSDFSALDNEAWLMDEDEADEHPEVPLVTDVDPDLPGDEVVQFVGDPKVWLDEDAVCVLVAAATSEGDASEKLEEAEVELLDDGGERIDIEPEFPSRWGASARSGAPLIAAKTVACFPLASRHCERTAGTGPARYRITLAAPGLVPASRQAQVPSDVRAGVEAVCAQLPREEP